MRRITIVGGGITGLAAAYDLERLTDAEIDLYERDDRLGGKLQTQRSGTLLVENGPDCFFSRKPGVLEFVRELGLEGELIEPQAGEFEMSVVGSLHRVPRGLIALAAPEPEAIREATFLSAAGKARALVPEPVAVEDDLSIREYFSRRYGTEFSHRVAEPLLAGTHGGDPARLSMRALYPAYLFPSPPSPPLPAGERGATFLSFRGGMRTLVDGLVGKLARTRLHVGARLETLPEAERVLVAVPANHAQNFLPGIGLDAIPHRSSAIVTFAFPREGIGNPLRGTGFLVPPSEASLVTGATWSSEKWPGRAPEDTILMRVFTKPDPDLDLHPQGFPETVLRTIQGLLGIEAAPIFQALGRWDAALPQYEVGHLQRVAKIERRLPEGVFVAGTSYRGVGVPDCLRQGREAARRIAETL